MDEQGPVVPDAGLPVAADRTAAGTPGPHGPGAEETETSRGVGAAMTSSPLALPGPGMDGEWVPPTWDDVVRTHSGRVFRLAYRLTGNRHDAEDLTQDVFVRVFRSLSTYTPGTFEGWLHRITTNLFLDRVRRAKRVRFDGLPDDAAERLAGREPTPAQAYDDRHLDYDIEAALAQLPPDFRAAVVLCDIEGLSYEEIAVTLGVKLGTVRSRIHRGRSQLRAALEHRAPAPAPAAVLPGDIAATASSDATALVPSSTAGMLSSDPAATVSTDAAGAVLTGSGPISADTPRTGIDAAARTGTRATDGGREQA